MIDTLKPPLDEAHLEHFDVLMHYGVKGMVWGTRKMAKLGGYKSTSDITTQERKSFKREVELATRGKGLARNPNVSSLTKKPVTKEFTRAVLRKTHNKKQQARYIKTGAVLTGVFLTGKAVGGAIRNGG